MLFKQKDLARIKSGQIDLAFRRWTRPSVKKGTLQKTSIGLVLIEDIEAIDINAINNEEIRRAGYLDRSSLLEALNSRSDGIIYKIKVKYHAPDPRIQLRNQTDISPEELQAISKKLRRMDNSSPSGPWTLQVLRLIQKNPKVRAKDLSEKTGKTKDWLKPNIRKLKNLGLTISHPLGYEISPRGLAVLKKLDD